VATYVLNRLSALNSGDMLYNGMPLNEGLIDDGSGRLCMQETNTLYNVSCLISIHYFNSYQQLKGGTLGSPLPFIVLTGVGANGSVIGECGW